MYQNNFDYPEDNKEIRIREILEGFIVYWKWFLVSVLLFISLAYVYLRYSIPQYRAAATILVKDDKKGGIASEMAAFSDLKSFSSVKNNVDNEIEVIKSRGIVKETVKALGLQIQYFIVGNFKDGEIYKNSPIHFQFLKESENFNLKSNKLIAEYNNANQFKLFDELGNPIGVYAYNKPFQYQDVILQANKGEAFEQNKNFKIRVDFLPLNNVVESFKSRLNVLILNKNASVIELSLIDPVSSKAEDFINELIIKYNEDAIKDKSFISENTSKFIENRLRLIAEELGDVESQAENFKASNNITDLETQAGLFLENASEFEKREIDLETQLKVVKTLQEVLSKNLNFSLLPSNLLSSDASTSSLIEQFNSLILERNRLAKNAGSKNTMLIQLDAKIIALQENIKSSLQKYKTTLLISKTDMQQQNQTYASRINKIPRQETTFRALSRQQKVKESLYLYLLQKREENAISLAVTAPNAKLIDEAKASSAPVSPNKTVIYILSLLVGFGLPFCVIYLYQLIDTKLKSRSDIEKHTQIPFIGEVPHTKENSGLIQKNSRTSAAEAIRIVRTNIEFLLKDVVNESAKTIFLTSTFPKEGKTFISCNLAATLAHANKKVLLIGLDIRNPKLNEYMTIPENGLTNFLSQNENTVEEYIIKLEGFNNFYVLPSGIVPPNPAEMLMDSKLDDLFKKFKKEFDYIVVDTAPVSLVTDTLLVSKFADTFVYVTRAGYLDKRMLQLPQKLYTESKLPNMSILLNDTKIQNRYGYGYGYGYGVEMDKKNWFQTILNLFKA